MSEPTAQPDNKLPRRWGHALLTATVVILLGSAALRWGWNTVAVDLFQAPAVTFKHALASMAALAALVAVPFLIARGSKPRRPHRRRLVAAGKRS